MIDLHTVITLASFASSLISGLPTQLMNARYGVVRDSHVAMRIHVRFALSK